MVSVSRHEGKWRAQALPISLPNIFLRKVDVLTRARISGYSDIALLGRVYYRESRHLFFTANVIQTMLGRDTLNHGFGKPCHLSKLRPFAHGGAHPINDIPGSGQPN